MNGCVQWALLFYFCPASIIVSSSVNTSNCHEELFQFSLDFAAGNGNPTSTSGLNQNHVFFSLT